MSCVSDVSKSKRWMGDVYDGGDGVWPPTPAMKPLQPPAECSASEQTNMSDTLTLEVLGGMDAPNDGHLQPQALTHLTEPPPICIHMQAHTQTQG